MNDTETMDRLYLELSQFTTARNNRECRAASLLRDIELKYWKKISRNDMRRIEQTINELSL